MSKNYFVHYWADFDNTYTLAHADADSADAAALIAAGYERITRAEAVRLCCKERAARHDAPAFSGFADAFIFPARAVLADFADSDALACEDAKNRFFDRHDGRGYIIPDDCAPDRRIPQQPDRAPGRYYFIVHRDGDEFAEVLPADTDRETAEAATVHAWQRLTLHEQRRAQFFGLIEAEPDDPDDPGTPGRWNACPNYDTAADVLIIKNGRRSPATAIYYDGARYLFGLDAIAADTFPADDDAEPLPF